MVEARAGVGQSALQQLLTTDDGAVRLGEAALVPQSSLVVAEDLTWRHALIDENDACHLALGRAYPACVADGPDMGDAERTDVGLNDSGIHADFVIGSPELHISGITTGGEAELLLANGEWAFEV